MKSSFKVLLRKRVLNNVEHISTTTNIIDGTTITSAERDEPNSVELDSVNNGPLPESEPFLEQGSAPSRDSAPFFEQGSAPLTIQLISPETLNSIPTRVPKRIHEYHLSIIDTANNELVQARLSGRKSVSFKFESESCANEMVQLLSEKYARVQKICGSQDCKKSSSLKVRSQRLTRVMKIFIVTVRF